jgi:hypothetical protein
MLLLLVLLLKYQFENSFGWQDMTILVIKWICWNFFLSYFAVFKTFLNDAAKPFCSKYYAQIYCMHKLLMQLRTTLK